MADRKPLYSVDEVGPAEFDSTDTIGVVDGGTGAVDAAGARSNLGAAAAADLTAAEGDITTLQADVAALEAEAPRSELAGTEIDFTATRRSYFKTLASDTTFTIAASPRQGAVVFLELDGDFEVTLPANVVPTEGSYDGSGGTTTLLELRCVSNAGGAVLFEARFRRFTPAKTGLIFRQVIPALFDDGEHAKNANQASGSPSTETLFSRLFDLESYRSPLDGLFHFRLVWPSLSKSVSWTQLSNPLDTYEVVDGFTVGSSTGGADAAELDGLSQSVYGAALLDGISDQNIVIGSGLVTGSSFMVGMTAPVTANIAAVGSNNVNPAEPSVNTDIVELYVDAA
ncbi:hypothetical protein [Engelhardtia mirabilis]|uniref:Uncharacterized protein n=1 Tax=Engelhardtia mirabilis TaxID=2528011 RepID=A0A518BL55_9BACT|nr:hypothetical protein Pla133_27930 [Planctomycetes bacterium Pla133]QDV02031.1 hypothetical protein Pla86_27920 [Planctomycetes bacterium Pla86]